MSVQERLNGIASHSLKPVYLVVGTEPFLQSLVKEKIVDAAVALEDRDLNVGTFNMEGVSVQEALQEANTLPFFGDRRVVFIQQPYFLTAEKERGKVEHELEQLIQYVERPLKSTVLVILAPYEKLDKRKAIVKSLQKKAVPIDVNPLTEREVEQYIGADISHNGYQIAPSTLKQFVEKTDYQLTQSMNELKKLYIAAIDTKDITDYLVDRLVSKTLEQNIFELNEAVLSKNADAAVALYRDLLLQKEDPIKLNAILLSQVRLLLQVSYLMQQGYQEPDIQKRLEINPYRIKLAIKQAKLQHIPILEQMYMDLVQTEVEMKNGIGLKEVQFELFLLAACQ